MSVLSRVASAAFALSATIAPFTASSQESVFEANAAFEQGAQLYAAGKYAESLTYLQLAANYGENIAAGLVGAMYLAGERVYGAGVPVDPVQARKWLQIASIKSQGALAGHRQNVAAVSAAAK